VLNPLTNTDIVGNVEYFKVTETSLNATHDSRTIIDVARRVSVRKQKENWILEAPRVSKIEARDLVAGNISCESNNSRKSVRRKESAKPPDSESGRHLLLMEVVTRHSTRRVEVSAITTIPKDVFSGQIRKCSNGNVATQFGTTIKLDKMHAATGSYQPTSFLNALSATPDACSDFLNWADNTDVSVSKNKTRSSHSVVEIPPEKNLNTFTVKPLDQIAEENEMTNDKLVNLIKKTPEEIEIMDSKKDNNITIISAVYIGTDEQYLTESKMRKIFRECALSLNDVKLYSLPDVPAEHVSANFNSFLRRMNCLQRTAMSLMFIAVLSVGLCIILLYKQY
jgi:hypothetical protein